jgi:hypothetical protein
MKWEDLDRDDLKMIPRMESHGYMVKFNIRDIMNKRITPENIPEDFVSFQKGRFHVWKMNEGYHTAWLINGGFRYDRRIESPEELLKEPFKKRKEKSSVIIYTNSLDPFLILKGTDSWINNSKKFLTDLNKS